MTSHTSMTVSGVPELSVIVAIVSDTTTGRFDPEHLSGCLETLGKQADPPRFEVIVPHHPPTQRVDELRKQFPWVTFVAVPDLRAPIGRRGTREHHDELRAHGLAAARGALVALLEDHARPDRSWCAQIVRAHRNGCAGVGGAIENGIDRPLNWAVYFCDFGRYQNPVLPGEAATVSDANASYKRSTLERIRPVWRDRFHETAVNATLLQQGERLALSPQVVVYQHRSDLRLRHAVRERFIWGRSYAAARVDRVRALKRLVYAVLSPALPPIFVWRMTRNVMRTRRAAAEFATALPLITLLTIAWSAGEFAGYVTARAAGR